MTLYRSTAAPLAVFLILGSSSVQAQEAIPEDLFCRELTTVIYYGNGVWSKPRDRVEARIALQAGLQGEFTAEEYEKLEFKISHNTTDGRIQDLLEATIQDLQTDISRFYRILSGIEIMPDWFQDAAEEVAVSVEENALVDSQDLQTHVSDYDTDVRRGKKVVVVPHSQGNFFANQAYNLIQGNTRESLGLVSVANPDSSVGGSGPYTTLVEDFVIAAIRAAKLAAGQPQLPLPANITNGFAGEASGHLFVESYLLSGTPSRGKILGDIVSTIDQLTEPEQEIAEGIITVTLTWGSEPDVDLHVFEPNGTHVYYANLIGQSGFLDRDDVTSFGPENYFVDCATLETGVYSVGVNYFFGFAPETARIDIQAGLLEPPTFSVFLAESRGSDGDSNPIPVADVIVTGSSEEGFAFEVVGN